MLVFSACIQQNLSFNEGFQSIDNLWKKNDFPALNAQWPHETVLEKYSLKDLNEVAKKLNYLEERFKEFDENMASYPLTEDIYMLKNFHTINKNYLSYLKKENELSLIYSDSFELLQESLQQFDSNAVLFEKCSSTVFKKIILLLEELSLKSDLLNDDLTAFDSIHKDFAKENGFNAVINKSPLEEMLSLFDSLQQVFKKNCDLQKSLFEWKEKYSSWLEKDSCKEIKGIESLALKAKDFVQKQQSILFDLTKLNDSQKLGLNLTDLIKSTEELSAAEIELEKTVYSLKVSCHTV